MVDPLIGIESKAQAIGKPQRINHFIRERRWGCDVIVNADRGSIASRSRLRHAGQSFQQRRAAAAIRNHPISHRPL
jgi:hypothetical protein